MDQVVEVAGYSSFEGVHHQVHPFPHHLHLYDNVRKSYICSGWTTYVLLFWPARGIATFQPLLVFSLNASAFLVLLPNVMPCVPLTQLLFQIMILFGETFHCCREGLDLPLQGSGSWLVSLNIVRGCYRESKYHATLCSGSESMAYKSLIVFPQMAPTDDAVKIISEPHSPRTLETIPAQ